MNKKSLIVAAALAAVVTGWMVSGQLTAETPAVATTGAETPAKRPMQVTVRDQVAEPVTRNLISQGEAVPERSVEVKAETAGRVSAILAERGARVASGAGLVRIALDDREARLAKIEALVAQREQEHQAARDMNAEGYVSQTQLKAAYTALQEARADREATRLDIARTTVRAPFAGVLNTRAVEQGDYVTPGAPIATVVDVDPLKVAIDVPQQHVASVRPGQAAEVKLLGVPAQDGRVSYVAATADSGTRTFRVEVEIPNPDGKLPAGLSAEVALPVATVAAHYVSPALLTPGEDGSLGVKTVDAQGLVAFNPVEIVRTERDGVWVSGLPERARLITQGQAFVRPGERVDPVVAEAASAPADMAGGTPRDS